MSVKIEKTSASLSATRAGENGIGVHAIRSAGRFIADMHPGTVSTQLSGMESNTEKIEEIKQAISKGYFQVDSRSVADSLIRFSCQCKHH